MGRAVSNVLAIPHYRALSLFRSDHGCPKSCGALFRSAVDLTVAGESVLAAIIFGVIFYFILLIKDLLIIDRRSSYEV